jgi:hypothetical protein
VNRKLLSLWVASAVAVPAIAWAEPAVPTSEEVKKVIEYYNNGKDQGPVLAEIVPCLSVDQKKGSATFLECTEPVAGKVKKGTLVNAWMNWLVPKDGKYEELAVQWLFEGVVRTTQDLKLTISGTNIRTWLASTPSKVGKWEIKVLMGSKELGGAKFEVE